MKNSLSVSEACTRCGVCASTCPWRIIELPERGLPRYREEGGERCNLCGHCEAVCPAGAMEVIDPSLDPFRHPPLRGEGWGGDGVESSPEITAAGLGRYLRMRRSVRRYREEPVDRSTIERLMDMVRYAPTGRNRQDVRWLVIHDTAEVRRVTGVAIDWMRESGAGTELAARFNVPGMVRAWEEGKDPLCQHAPHLFIAYARRDDPFAGNNAMIALAHLDMAAPAFGLGTCWGGIFVMAAHSSGALREALQLPPEHVPVHCLMLGYPAVRYRRPPKRKASSIVWR